MMVKIAVEEPFTSVQQALVKKGYKAEMLEDKTDAVDYDCVVVRDKEDLVDFHMNVPLVEAKGRTLFEIIEEVEERLVRSGKIMPPTPVTSENKSGGGGFIAGAATGALIGAAAGLMLAPKSGKEMQQTVKDKAAEMKEKKEAKAESGENSGPGKLDQVKEKVSGVTDKAKGKADELKAKREEKKEDKELKKQQKVIEKEAKEEEKAKKEHEKAIKQAEKEEKKAEKEEQKESGGIEVVEFGSSAVDKKDSGEVNIHPAGKDKK